MKIRLAVVVLASIVELGACTTVGNSPATAPPITASPVTASTATASTTVTTTTVPETTTTVDRIAEIQAIFQDLERRRLQAIMDQDEEAFRAVFANAEYEEQSMVLMDKVVVVDPAAVSFRVTDVYADAPGCIAVGAVVDMSAATDGGGVGEDLDYVVETASEGWGLSWTGSGWRCGGSHPFSD